MLRKMISIEQETEKWQEGRESRLLLKWAGPVPWPMFVQSSTLALIAILCQGSQASHLLCHVHAQEFRTLTVIEVFT